MNEPIVITELTETCGGCPAQWEGKTTDGAEVYIRFRWGGLRLDIDGSTVFTWEDPQDDWRGVMDTDELRHRLKGVAELPDVIG